MGMAASSDLARARLGPAPVPVPVLVERLALVAFRNHGVLELEPGDARTVLLLGPNGAGKTSVVEALSLLAPGRGLRGAALADMARAQGPGGFAIAARLRPDPGLPPLEIRTGTRDAAGAVLARRQLTLGGAPAALSAPGQWHAQLWLTPSMDRLFVEGAAARRRFLDRLTLALHPGHGGHAARYERALAERGRLLALEAQDAAWLDEVEAVLAREGSVLAAARRATVDALSAALAAAAPAGFPRARVALAGDRPEADWPALLKAGRAADAAAGRAMRAPHRVDLDVRLADTDLPAAQASSGEQKALLLALLLVHAGLVSAHTGRLPLLLLDEAAAHLDAARREALFAALAALGGQAWLTGTDARLFDGLESGFRRQLGAS